MKKSLLFILLVFSLFILFTQNTNAEPRRAVLEFVTGTWCPWCPCGDEAAEQILTQYPNTVVIAYHGASSDPWQNFPGSTIRTLLGFTAYPTGVIERMNAPSNPYVTYDMWMPLIQSRMTNSPNSVINVVIASKNYNASTRELSMTINSTALEALAQQYKITYVLTEDNLIYAQSGNTTCVGGSNFNHKWVVRSMLNSETGINLNTGTWNANQTITKTLTTTLDAAWVPANCNVNIIVFRDTTATLCYAQVQQGAKQNVLTPVGITPKNEIPAAYSLSQNYPNPFNPNTHIKFTIPKDGTVSLKLYDALGKVVATYVDGFIKAGTYNTEVDGTSLTSGVYFYKLTAGDFSDTKKMILIK